MFNPETSVFAANQAIQKLTESGAVGYVDGKKYEVVIDPSKDYEKVSNFVKVSDFAPTMDEIVGGTMIYPNEDVDAGFVMEEGQITSDMLMPAMDGYGYTIMAVIWVVTKNGGGLEVGIYVGEDAFDTPAPITIKWSTETIHPIDPKFLPESGTGGGLPEITLTSFVPAPGEDSVVLKDDESAAFNEIANTVTNGLRAGTPIVIRFLWIATGGAVACVGVPVVITDGEIQYMCSIGPYVVAFTGKLDSSDSWSVQSTMLALG